MWLRTGSLSGVTGAVVLVASLGCGGRVTVEGPVIGSCHAGQGNWSCETTDADAGATSSVLVQCPSGFNPSGACPMTLPSGSGPLDGQPGTPGLTNVQAAPPTVSDCFDCTSSGLGVDWVCGDGRWVTNGAYACSP
jgi:hypothetical protein